MSEAEATACAADAAVSRARCGSTSSLREVAAEELERIDDERLELVTITSVDVDADLRRAVVYFDCLARRGGDDEVLEALGDAPRRGSRRRSAARPRLKRTPMLTFRPDDGHPHGRAHRGDPPRAPRSTRPRRRPATTDAGDAGRCLTASRSSTSRPAGPATTSWPVPASVSASGASATPARSIPTPPGCCSSASGRATRLLRFLTALPKTYTGEVVFGVETSTLDASGEVDRHARDDALDADGGAPPPRPTPHRPDHAGAADGVGR